MKEHQQKDDLENATQRCEDANVRKHSILLHKNLLDQGETRSYWRQCRRSRSGDYNLEWSPNFMGIFHSRDLLYKEAHLWRSARKKNLD